MADEYTKEKLTHWGYEGLIDIFDAEGVDKEALLALNEFHITKLIKGIGMQAKFLRKLEDLRKIKNSISSDSLVSYESKEDDKSEYEIDDPGLVMNSTEMDIAFSSNNLNRVEYSLPHLGLESEATKRRSSLKFDMDSSQGQLMCTKLKLSSDTLDLAELIRNDLDGKELLYYSKTHDDLAIKSRNKLANLLVKAMMNGSKELTNANFEEAAGIIPHIFPSESKFVYYVPPGNVSKISHGKLPDKYRNLRFQMMKTGVISRKEKKMANTRSASVLENVEEFEEEITWLHYNHEPWNMVCDYWKQTTAYRKAQKEDEELIHVSSFLEKWPVLRDPRGHILIEMDFSSYFNGKETMLFSSWVDFSAFLFDKALQLTIKQDMKELFDYGKSAPEEQRNLIALLLLPDICPPTCNIKGNGKTKVWRPSVAECRDSFILLIPSASDLESSLSLKRQKLEKFGSCLQPLIVVIGTYREPIKMYTYIDGILYDLPCILKCLDICFKSFFTLNARYPEESTAIWLFIQRVVYQIEDPSDRLSPTLFGLIAEYNRKLCK